MAMIIVVQSVNMYTGKHIPVTTAVFIRGGIKCKHVYWYEDEYSCNINGGGYNTN